MITVKDIAYVRTQAPDLETMELFLIDFGMVKVARTDHALYMRGAGPQPVIHITERASEGAMPGVGLIAASMQDLETAALESGANVEVNSEPGGGHVVRLTDPVGYRVDVVHRETVQPLPTRKPSASNVGADRRCFGRRNETQRPNSGPSTVLRLGHVVYRAPQARQIFTWYGERFGFEVSDSAYAGAPENDIMIMARCGLGAQYTDHHTLAFAAAPMLGVDHSAFEVLDWDDLAVGNQHLTAKGYRHALGIGRHVVGSQIFDYWRDPAGIKIEHWTDGDYVNDDYQSSHEPIGNTPMASWGPEVTPDFFT